MRASEAEAVKEKEPVSPTYRTCILARPQKAPSVNLLMLLRCSFRTSRLSSPWNVSPSIRRMRFRFSSLQSPSPYKFIKAHSPFSPSHLCSTQWGQQRQQLLCQWFPGDSTRAPETFNPRAIREGSWVQWLKQTHPRTDYREITECSNSSSSLLSLHFF